jgi:transcriptional regulator with GAF, ATPase, and Fis domain
MNRLREPVLFRPVMDIMGAMKPPRDVLLSVWQEACRNIRIDQSMAAIAPMLTQHIAVEQIVIRRIDTIRSCLETVAVGFAEREQPADVRTDCPSAEFHALLTWCLLGQVAKCRGNGTMPPDWAKLLLAPDASNSGDVLVGPLGNSEAPYGLLIFLAPAQQTFGSEHVDFVQQLLEPFSAALDNDLRMREITAFREAAEADKRSLLTRLGRKALGDTIVGVDSGLHAVMDRVELVARSDAPVLIFGETGTGKELIARAIHNRSSRRQGPFDRVNCGAIPPELIDSQLFGHERGAFTGAVESRRGWFERADGGTLFLDEIGELPLAAQVRMLRILQDGWMERVGGEKSINVDVRIIAATHRDLATMVSEGKFREDLWYRIAIFPIVLPPLRERREDIAKLATHFVERAATRFGLARVAPTPEDLALLTSYAWPGNVRELGAVIDRAAILGEGKRLEVAKALGVDSGLPEMMHAHGRTHTASHRTRESFESLDVAIQRHIEAALTMTQGQVEGKQGAAALLQINPHTLRAKMRKLGIDWAKFRTTP